MRGIKRRLEITSRSICHYENGLRAFPLEETLARLEHMLLNTRLELQFERKHLQDSTLFNSVLRSFSPEGPNKDRFSYGKGLSNSQALVSAFMEFIERFSSFRRDGDSCTTAAYNDVRETALNPADFYLPGTSLYRPDTAIEWMWGYSLTNSQPILVPANLVFFPYEPVNPEMSICWSDSNGLASGNCLEEAILHALLEIIERDAIYIVEFNRLNMPDLSLEGLAAEEITVFLENLKAAFIQTYIKIISTDLPVPTIGVFLEGKHEGLPCCSYAAGAHLSPRLALSRALTEAFQLYPRCANYDAWISSATTNHYRMPGYKRVPFGNLSDISTGDMKTNIEKCVEILREIDSEVIVVDLSLTDLPFSVVRVCATRLQPYCTIENQRLSERLYEVPGRLGFRSGDSGMKDFRIRPLCGFR